VRAEITGAVQGVGFRPFVHGLAARHGLSGFVRNDASGVTVEAEGPDAAVAAFLDALRASPPPASRVTGFTVNDVPPRGETGFRIDTSRSDTARSVLVLPDLATCGACLAELRDPADRRFRYPFINCTHCGPRYTIIRDLPYDRAKTTMAPFEMCPDCRAEYESPADRRFHAEPTCCPVCGPRLRLVLPDGAEIPCDDPVAETRRLLLGGAILAIKGLGGYHLACDATSPDAVGALRRRKARDFKPFAVMAADPEAVARICHADPDDLAIMGGPECPILLLDKRDGHGLADAVAPRSATFGVMLPYTPLHHLLLEPPFPPLVMTSGNRSDEPIAYRDEDALERLDGLADAFLLHDRTIHTRTDDSVIRRIAGGRRFLRRSRGYAPFPVAMPVPASCPPVLAVGAELNSVVCLTRGSDAFLSHHIGDLDNLAAYESFLQAVAHLESMLDVRPGAVACDLHPSYLSTRYARERGLPLIQVQHHHAHLASVLAEHGETGPAIGVTWDGVGHGTDGLPWGGEFLTGGLDGFTRAAMLEPVPQPGGDAAVKHGDRMAFSFLLRACPDEADTLADALLPALAPAVRDTIRQMIGAGVNAPLSSSAGRLFDAASALLGICDTNHFHAQAPMELEAAAAACTDLPDEPYALPVDRRDDGAWVARTPALVLQLARDRLAGRDPTLCAARFHLTLAVLGLDICRRIRDNTRLETVALTGGVMANAVLAGRMRNLLEKDGFRVLLNREAPPGDGGVALGQAAVAAWRLTCASQSPDKSAK
jgi:hydrogenase maturation protein HypF